MDYKPRVSVICIALCPEEFEPLRQSLSQQSFQNFEFVGETGGTIPEAWNKAIARSQGEILVFTETDATPFNEYWLEELVTSVPDENTVVKGLEITGTPLDLANLAAHRSIFENVRFDETFLWAEDTELFCKLKEEGLQIVQIDRAPVIHPTKNNSKHKIRRAFRYGLYWARLRHRYKDPVELMNVSNAGKTLIAALLNLLGMGLGFILYYPERWYRRAD